MEDDSLEERTLEVLNIPESISDDLLSLYFENERRSGGGALTSLDKQDGKATLVFEDARVAARVCSKGPHVLDGATLTVKKKAPNDPLRFLLCGLHPRTSTELVELYVENVIGVDTEYTLFPSPGKNLVLIQFFQPFSEDFQRLCANVSKRKLEGADLRLERLECTDSILVENLHPSTTEDMLNLYFVSGRGGGEEVTDVQMLAEGIARVSFKDFESVNKVLTKPHKLDDSELKVKPYFTVLLPENSVPSSPLLNGTSSSVPMEIDQMAVTTTTSTHPVSPTVQTTHLFVAHAQFTPQTSPVSLYSASPTTSTPLSISQAQEVGTASGATEAAEVAAAPAQMAATPPATAAAVSFKPKPGPRLSVALLSSNVAVSDPVKLSLLEMSGRLQELQATHSTFNLSITKDGVSISGPDQLWLDKLKSLVLEFLGGIAQSPLPLEPQKVEFLAKEDVKAKLLQTLKDQGLLSTYTVSDGVAFVTSLSYSMVNEACKSIKSLICEFTIPVQRHYECALFCQEWSAFLQTINFCLAKVTDAGENITVVTLKGMEEEAQTKIILFLSTPIQRETVISMEPGRLKYLQIHCGQLLAEMDQITLFPLETGDGLTISGNAGACQIAEEILRGVVDEICTKTITVSQPGVSRFLVEQEGSSILAELQAKFQVYISMEKVHWEPLEEEDLFESGWKLMAQQSFQRNADAVDSASSSNPAALVADQSMERSRIEEAKQLLSGIGDEPSSLTSLNMSEEDIYTVSGGAAHDEPDASAMQTEASTQASPLTGPEASPLVPGDAELDLARQLSMEAMNCSSLDDDARMSLAIQYSMESTRSFAFEDEDEDELQKVLELSLRDISAAAAVGPAREDSQLKKAMETSLQDAIRAANVAEIFVFANYTHDLIRTDIALGKKAGLRQCEEKVGSKNLKNLTAHHQRCLDLVRRKHAVDIRVEGTTAVISGFKDFVAEAVPTVKDLVRRMGNVTSDRDILKVVQWEWHEQGPAATATPYPPDATVYLENAWKMKQKKIDILFDHQPHIIDFEKMQEINVASRKSVSIARKLLSSQNLAVVVPEEEFSLLSSMPDVSCVDESSDEFQDVVKEFYDSIEEFHNKIKIIKVEKLKNSLLYNQYKLKKASMLQNATDQQVEQTLFHGTSETSVKEICVHGFNRSFCGKNATVYGQGVYFAVNSALSVSDTYSPPNADGHKFVFMAKVLTGDYTVGKHEMKTAPLKESSAIPLRYDSVADKMTSPTLFVIFNDTQAYPEYLVTCQKIYR